MIHKIGKNYHFFLASANSIARIQSEINPFYPFLKQKPAPLPSLSSDPLLVPTFIYDVFWNRVNFKSKAIYLPPYIQYTGKKIFSQTKLSDEVFYLDQKGNPVQRISSLPFPAPSKIPFFIQIETKQIIQIGGIRNDVSVQLSKTKRTKFESAKYLSLRDIVNPNFSEEDVIKKIETLYFDKKNKNYLYRLVKILYSGKAEEEYKIISNLFAHELDFAKFLSNSMFSAEIIPLIHGPFLQAFINKFDERLIKFAYPKLSPPVRKMLDTSVSKNKLQMILNAPPAEPKPGESLLEMLESEVYRKFSRNIYYENGFVYTYRDRANEIEEGVKIKFEESKKVNFWTDGDALQFYGQTQTKILLKTTAWIDTLRIDWFLSKREWEPYEFHRLPPELILEIPFFPTGKFVLGAGITNERKTFEMILQWFEY